MTPSLSLALSGSGQGGNRSVPKKETEIHGVDFRVVNWVFYEPGSAGKEMQYLENCSHHIL